MIPTGPEGCPEYISQGTGPKPIGGPERAIVCPPAADECRGRGPEKVDVFLFTSGGFISCLQNYPEPPECGLAAQVCQSELRSCTCLSD